MRKPTFIYTVPSKVADVLNTIEKSGKFFTVEFFKADGTYRIMNAKFLPKDTRARYINNGEHHSCLTCMDVTKKAFRQIPMDRVKRIRANGVIYEVA